jgi:hypothetical protein
MKLENQLNELWVTIEGFAGQYEVSNLGRIRSLDMLVWSGRSHYMKKGRILKPGLGGNGYLTVAPRGVSQKVSRLVAIAFVPKIEGKEIVNHIDGNKLNNLATNLEWEDHHGNEKHAYRTGLKNSNSVRKLSKSDYAEIIKRRGRGEKFTEIHKDYQQVTISTIKRIGHIYNKTRGHKHGKQF